MGYLCNGKYEVYQYLRDVYQLKPYKSYTTRKITKYDTFDIFQYVPKHEIFKFKKYLDMVALREEKNVIYGKRISDIPEGLSVCVIDYQGYIELSRYVETVGILIVRDRLYRFEDENCPEMKPNEFMEYEQRLREQYDIAWQNKQVKKVVNQSWEQLKIKIDDVIFEYIPQIEKENNVHIK